MSRIQPRELGCRLLGAAVERLPSSIVYAAAALWARLLWRRSAWRALHRRRAGLVLGAVPRPCVDAVARECARSSLFASLEVMRLGRASRRGAVPAAVEGLERLRAASADGRGVVLVSAHLGTPELGALALLDAGNDLVVLRERRHAGDGGCARRLMQRGRARSRLTYLDVDLAGLRAAAAHLRRGGMVAVLADVDTRGTGAEVELLAGRALLPTVPLALALRTGAALVPVFAMRVGGRERCAVSVQAAIDIAPGEPTSSAASRRERLRRGTQLLAHALSAGIRTSPGQWFRDARWIEANARDSIRPPRRFG